MKVDIYIRRFDNQDANEVADVIATTLRISNTPDYSVEFIDDNIESHSVSKLIEQARDGHFYVACEGIKIIGCGGIVGYWGSLTESFIMTFFVLPDYQRQGIGKKLLERIESDEIFIRAKRIEIAASITACDFYRKQGYTYKNDVTIPDEYGCIRLEKHK